MLLFNDDEVSIFLDFVVLMPRKHHKKQITKFLVIFITMSEEKKDLTLFLIYGGKTGWIGQQLVKCCQEKNIPCVNATSRLENRQDVIAEIEKVKPTHVLISAGLTGRPNVCWCESNKEEVLRVNVIGIMNVVDVCWQHNIHVTNFASGCIFKYDDAHPIGGPGFTEEDEANFFGSFYSQTKGTVENLLRNYDNCLTLRLRMPLSSDLHPRNFITKILNYEKVVNIPNSMTMLDDMLPRALECAQRKVTGVLNFCNPGAISHNEILQLYKQFMDESFKWQNFSESECNAILKAQRSNNTLSHTKLVELFPDVPDIHTACVKLFCRMRVQLDAYGKAALIQQGWHFPEASV